MWHLLELQLILPVLRVNILLLELLLVRVVLPEPMPVLPLLLFARLVLQEPILPLELLLVQHVPQA
jgi:hypothetical protein